MTKSPPPGVPEELIAEARSLASGDAPAPDTDLYTLFSALTTLTGEIRLQGRAFKQLSDLLTPLAQTPDLISQLREAQLQSTLAMENALAERSDRDAASPVEFKQVCDVMIDLYDRLQRGLLTCDAGIQSLQARPRTGLFHRLAGTCA